MRNVIEILRDAVPASASVGGASVAGAVAGAPAWLIGLGQAAIVVIFTLRGIDRRLKAITATVDQTKGELDVLTGRVHGLEKALLTPVPRA